MTAVDRARRYIAAMPPAVSASGGHVATFAAAVALRRGFSLPENLALDLLREWNLSHCDPPWSDAELRHKIRSAAQADKPHGYLLDGAEAATRSTSLADADAQKKADSRKSWPPFRPLSAATLADIATLRRLPLEAVHIANRAGLLAGTMIEGHRCFVLTEGDFAQARRLDGGKLKVADGESKAKNLLGSQGRFTGRALLGGPQCPVLLVEGAIGILEGIAAALAVEADTRGWTVLAATSASSRFDSAWLERVKGRRVRIVPDQDPAGMDACAKWTASLETVSCAVDAIRLPGGFKDIGDVAADPAVNHETLKSVFHL